MPSRDHIEAELSGAEIFTRLDAKAGFHQIPLDDETSKIYCFANPFGRYRFLRLPFGIPSASEVFQKLLCEMFDSLPGVHVYAHVDDILVCWESREQPDQRLRAVLETAKRAGLTFNADKCKVGVQEIKFLGDVISCDGIKPNRAFVDSVRQMSVPSDKLGVQRLLGVENYFSKYIPFLAHRTSALRSLTKRDAIFELTLNHTKERREICDAVCQGPLLAILDPAKEIKVTSDASMSGVGSALLQRHGSNWRPVAYAWRTLTSAEQRYSQIERGTGCNLRV